MRGLLIKDLKYIKNQRMFLLVLAAVSVYFILSGQNITFVMTYMSAMLATLIVSTVGYDEQDNGMGYLFTFPISRKIYVYEKYVFGILIAGAMVIMGGIVLFATSAFKEQLYSRQDILLFFAVSLLVPVLLQSIMLPVIIKFGTEKSRAALVVVFGIFVLVSYGIKQVQAVLGVDVYAELKRFLQGDTVAAAALVLAAAVLMIWISIGVSLAVMKRKQF